MRSVTSLVIFLAVFSCVVAAIHYYLWARLVRAPDLGPEFQRVGTIVVVVLAVLLPLGIITSRLLPREHATVPAFIAYTWFGFMVLLMFSLLGGEIVRLLTHAGHALAGADFTPARRLFLSRSIAAASGGAAVIFGVSGLLSVRSAVRVKNVDIKLSRFPASMNGFKLVQLTDIHIGSTIGRDWLQEVVDTVNALEPDAIAITGDLVDGSVADLREHVAPLGNLKAKHGVFFVTGNHEYYSGVDDWLAELATLNIRVLRNERVAIQGDEEGFDLAGVDDHSARRFGRGHGPDLKRAIKDRDGSRELVLLAHQPKQIVDAVNHGVGLQISGHTHGGQIFPWGWFVRLDQQFVAGLSKLEETQIYVSSGTGYWGPPMRVGAPAEITLLALARA